MLSASTRSVIIDSVIAKWTLTLALDEPRFSGNPYAGVETATPQSAAAVQAPLTANAQDKLFAQLTLRRAHSSPRSHFAQVMRGSCAGRSAQVEFGKLADKG
jgi:hypothetical protein